MAGAEKEATLDVATRLARKLRESQFRTVMTRSSDVFIPLDERAAISNRQKNAIFVSVHFNDSRRRGIRGFETYYHSPVARNLAYRIQQHLVTIPGSANRGVKTANFRVLRKALYPAVLVECGFLSNRKGRRGRAKRQLSRRTRGQDRGGDRGRTLWQGHLSCATDRVRFCRHVRPRRVVRGATVFVGAPLAPGHGAEARRRLHYI